MPTAQLGGLIGSFPDNVQGRDVPVMVVGTFDFTAPASGGDPGELENWVRGSLLNAIRSVIGQKMLDGQLTFRHLAEGNIGAVMGEIIAAANLGEHGIQVGNLSLQFGIDGRAPGTAPQQADPSPQHVVHAEIRVGGFNINASTEKGLDTKGLTNQLKDKVKSNLIWYGAGCAILLIVGVGIAGLALYVWKTSSGGSSPGSATVSKWDGKTPFACGGNDVVKIEGVTAKLAATAVTAAGNCHLTLVNVSLTAPTGIEAMGTAVVTMQGGSITATTLSVHAGAAAQVHVTGTTVSGKTTAEGAAKITGILSPCRNTRLGSCGQRSR